MKVVITITFCCDNLYKSMFMALEKPGKLESFFLLLYGHPVYTFLNNSRLRIDWCRC